MAYQVFVQQGVVDLSERPDLVAGLRSLYADVFDVEVDHVAFSVTEVPAGLWFTAGEPSRASLVTATVPAGTRSDLRTALLEGICDHWRAATGCGPDYLLAVAADGPD